MSTITELPAEPELSLPGPIEALGGQKSWRNYRPTRKVEGVEYACIFDGKPVKSTQAISDTILAVEIEGAKALTESRLIFLAHPQFAANNTGVLQGKLIPIASEKLLKSIPEIATCPGKGLKCNFYDNTTLYLSFDGEGLRKSDESEKQAIETYIMTATGIGKDTLGENGEEIEIFERSSVFGGVAKGRIKNATTGQGYTGWIKYTGPATAESGKRNNIYEKTELKTTDEQIITYIDSENSCNILGGIVPVYLDGQKRVYVQKSLNKDGRVVVVDFQSSKKDGRQETILPNSVTVPREGDIFIIWVGKGQPRFFKKDTQTNGAFEEIEKNSVRVSGSIHSPSCIDEIEPISGKLIHHKPDSVSQRLENILTGNRTF